MTLVETAPGTEPPQPEPQPTGGRLNTILGAAFFGWVIVSLILLLFADAPDLQIASSIAHLGLFAGLTLTAIAWVRRPNGPNSRLIWAVVGAALFGGLTEVLQAVITSDRAGQLNDVWFDLLGAAVGATVALLVFVVFRRRARAILAVISITALLLLIAIAIAGGSTARFFLPDVDCGGADTSAVKALDPTTPELVYDGATESITTPEGIRNLEPRTESVPLDAIWCDAAREHAFTAFAVVSASDPDAIGPDRIISSAEGYESNQINFQLGQEGTSLVIRIRTGADGTEATDEMFVDGVFDTDSTQHIVVRFDEGDVTVWVNGEEADSFETQSIHLADWDVSRPLTIGDESIGGREFAGDIDRVEFHTRALSDGEATALSR